MYGMNRERIPDNGREEFINVRNDAVSDVDDDDVDAETDTETSDTDTSDTDTGEMDTENERAQSLEIREAVKNNNLDAVEGILHDDENLVSDENIYEETLLHTAAKEGHDAMVDLLIKKGAHVDALTKTNETPLHMAIPKAISIANVIYLLISNGTDINAKDNVAITPLNGLKKLKKIMTDVEPYVRMQNKRPGSGDTPPAKRRRTSLRFL